MNEESGAVLLVVGLPLAVVWVVVIVDLVRRSQMSRGARWAWGVACTLVWPMMLAYLLMKPTRGRLEAADRREDPRGRLVDAALAREAGRLDDAEWVRTVAQVRQT